jgi:hypothetical protein
MADSSLFGGLFGAAGSIAGSLISAGAIESATQTQVDALNQQRDFVFSQLNPATINAQASSADIQNAAARLALQAQIDPALAALRGQSEQQILGTAANLGQQGAAVAGQTTAEALRGLPGLDQGKAQLIDAALNQLKLGATLPPDVENQLVQAGLEQSGMVTQHASGQGVGGQMLRTILGTAGVQLQQQRQQQAAQLMSAASNLEAQRQNILQGLFPRLTEQQLQTLGGQQSALGTSASMLPAAGLTGSDVANIWLARVGATNQLAQSAAATQARGTMGVGNALGSAVGTGVAAIPSISAYFSTPGATAPTATDQNVLASLNQGLVYQ